jgi:hypothetical protein
MAHDILKTGKSWKRAFQKRAARPEQWVDDPDTTELRRLVPSLSSATRDTLDLPSHQPNRVARDNVQWAPKFVARCMAMNAQGGWRAGVVTCAVSASVVFFINFIITIWVLVRNSNQHDDTLYEGDCDRTSQLNTGVHAVINLLSTVLLGASNYCMQCLSAPTRSEIDGAHAKHEWLDIGVSSIRNLTQISGRRVAVWFLLGLSSLPLHLL